MKLKVSVIIISSMLFIIAFSYGADGMMNGPKTGQPDGTGDGPGPDDGQEQGPRWKQETSNKRVEKGLLFRYGMDSPSSTLEGEETGRDIGLHLTGMTFHNGTTMMFIEVGEEEWTVDEKNDGSETGVSYSCQGEWYEEGTNTGKTSRITVDFWYLASYDERSLDYNITLEDPPGEGSLTFRLVADARGINDGCCWTSDDGMESSEERKLKLRNFEGVDLTMLDLGQPGLVDNGTGTEFVETELGVDLNDSTATLDVGMSLQTATRSASISGSLILLEAFIDTLMDGLEQAALFVIDHIYYFIGGAVVMTVLIIGAMSVVSSKKVDTGGSELDLKRNRYYRGPQ